MATAPSQRISYARKQYEARLANPPADTSQPHNAITALLAYRRPLAVKELAPILGMSEYELYERAKKGIVPAMHVPGSKSRKFDPSVVADWLGKHNPQMRRLARAS